MIDALKSFVAALLLCSCAATNTQNEARWQREYAQGKMSWSEYQTLLAGEQHVND